MCTQYKSLFISKLCHVPKTENWIRPCFMEYVMWKWRLKPETKRKNGWYFPTGNAVCVYCVSHFMFVHKGEKIEFALNRSNDLYSWVLCHGVPFSSVPFYISIIQYIPICMYIVYYIIIYHRMLHTICTVARVLLCIISIYQVYVCPKRW